MKKNVLWIAAGIFTVIIFVGLRKNSAPFFSAKEYQCVQNSLLSDNYFFSINSAFADLYNERCSAHVIIDRLKQQFSALKKVIIAYRPSGTRVMISAYEPVCLVNNTFVLTARNEIFPKNVYSEQAIIDVPEIEVAQNSIKNAPQLISSLLQHLSPNISEIYNIELMTKHYVRFVDKQQPQFTVVASLAQEKLPQLLQQSAVVKQSINEKNGFDKGVTWIADTRFDHYIVAYKA